VDPSTDFPSPSAGETLAQDPASVAAAAAESARLMNRVGRYELLGLLGRGGMGEVYRARDPELHREVALKLIRGGDASETAVRRFRLEAETVAALDHPGLVPVYEAGEHDGCPYLVMKLLPGGTLADRVAALRADRPAAVRLLADVARAVHHAHQRGVLHRDLKPGNILLDADGRPLVADFGLAKRLDGGPAMSVSGAVVGTPAYMAPEQAAGRKDVSTAADVYALGAVLYELLVGRSPFHGESVLDTLRRVADEPPPRLRDADPTIDPGLELVCLRCLEKDPTKRYPTAAALADDLDRWRAGEPLSVRPPSLTGLVRLWTRQNFGSLGWAAVGGLACGLVIGGYTLLEGLGAKVARLGAAYDALPAVPRPWLARTPVTEATLAAAELGMYLLLPALLLATAVLVRPRTRSADLAAGLLTGVVTGVTFFTVAWGWWSVYSTAVLPAVADLELIAGPDGPLLERYPDLHTVPADQRRAVLVRKVQFDQAVRIQTGLAVGVILPAAVTLPVCTTLVGLGAALLRRHGRVRAVVPRYFEIAMPGLVFAGNLFLLFQRAVMYGGPPQHPLVYAALLGLTAVAVRAAVRDWPWPVRAALAAGWLGFYAATNAAGLYEF
jgi:hypothetical protein